MALFMKQDFSSPVLSRKWFAMKFRPNMLLHSREHIISILESGLLFREDSVDVEQGAPTPGEVWRAAGGARGGWFTKGEGTAGLVAVVACFTLCPPKGLHRVALAQCGLYLAAPLAVRAWLRRRGAGGGLSALLAAVRGYLALARRAAACLRECAALRNTLGSVSTVVSSLRALLCRQQSELAVLGARASSALLGNAPWLRGDLAWEAVERRPGDDDLMKIHHAFLVVQSTLFKNIAMAHFIPPKDTPSYKNHNERLYWLHTVLIERLLTEFRENYEALDRMYRLLKNYGNTERDVQKKPGAALSDNWLYSDVHSGVATACFELKVALNKCTDLDMFLDSCALNKQTVDLDILNKDVDDLIDDITKCLSTAQNSQIKLKKLKSKLDTGRKTKAISDGEKENVEDDVEILKIEDAVPEIKDEVFYFIKTEDDDKSNVQPVSDITTGPGKKERDTTKIVLSELKRRLVKREDVMRERERQALAKTMPELKDHIPEFPRQINVDDFLERKGFISKLHAVEPTIKRKLFKTYKIRSRFNKHSRANHKGYKLKVRKYENENDISDVSFEANEKLNVKNKLVTVSVADEHKTVTRWCKVTPPKQDYSSGVSEGVSDVETSATNETVKINHTEQIAQAKNYQFSQRDLELSPSSSESDLELYKGRQMELLNDVRKHRVARKKNHPVKRCSSSADREVDESLRPMEYSFGTGMAMASVLQVNKKFPNMAQEEVFIGDGEVSNDSGNDEDA